MPSAGKIEEYLREDPSITHVAMVHSETTSGILNDIASVAEVVKRAGKIFIVDAMSSFGGVDIEVQKLGIDYLVSSANTVSYTHLDVYKRQDLHGGSGDGCHEVRQRA